MYQVHDSECLCVECRHLKKEEHFRSGLEQLLNKYSMENGSGTPDFILARYLADALKAFDNAIEAREKWYGRES